VAWSRDHSSSRILSATSRGCVHPYQHQTSSPSGPPLDLLVKFPDERHVVTDHDLIEIGNQRQCVSQRTQTLLDLRRHVERSVRWGLLTTQGHREMADSNSDRIEQALIRHYFTSLIFLAACAIVRFGAPSSRDFHVARK